MAENKKGFILYSDQKSMVDLLSDEKAGMLFKHILNYVNDKLEGQEEHHDPLVNLAFMPIKLQLKRDLQKFEKTKNGRSIAGKAGAKARWQSIAKDGKRIKPMAKMAVNDNDNDNDIKKGGFLGLNIPFKNFWEMYGKKEGFNYTENYWNNLNPETQKTIMEFLPKYIASKPNPRYRKKPENFLIDETWKDELPEMDLSEIKDKTDPRFKLLTREDKIKWIKANIKF